MRSFIGLVFGGFLALFLTGCGGNVQVSAIPNTTFTVGGTVTGLNSGATLSVLLNNTTTLSVTANGPFTFTLPVQTDVGYLVAVVAQPTGETCTVANYTAPSLTANVANVNIVCSVNTFTIAGTVSGLSSGVQVSLLDNGGNSLAVTANGAFTFTTPVAYDGTYNVTVGTNPTGETCTVSSGTGSGVIANVSSVSVLCAVNTFLVGGTVAGLGSGQVTLENNGGDSLMVSANGPFVFDTSVAYNGGYNVMVQTQPVGETCSVMNGTGLATVTDITNVAVTCAVNTFAVSGTVSGLGSGVQVTLVNGSDSTAVMADGAFSFTTQVPYGGSYDVTVGTNPTGQMCTVSNATGTLVTAPVANVSVVCAVDTYTVGGAVSGLSAAGLVLKNNGADPLAVNSGATSFQFATPIAYDSGYAVSVFQEPVNETCTPSNATGSLVMANVTTVGIACAVNQYTLGGTVSGLSGSVTLEDNSSNSTTISSNGAFTFSTDIIEGNGYNVTVETQPVDQTCSVVNGAGTVGGANVTNVSVSCSTNSYTVGGTVSGLVGTVMLLNNGANSTTINSSGAFTFSTPVAEGSTYNVTVVIQPVDQTCSVVNGTGTVGGANVTNVSVSCSTNSYTIGGTVSGLSGTVVLQEYGANSTAIISSGSFTFSNPVAEGNPYNVTVLSQPAAQTCSVVNGAGTVGGANVTNVSVTCSTNYYTVGGTVSGLSGTVTLQNNDTNATAISSNGSFTFSRPVVEGSPYSVTVLSQPAGQTCTVVNGNGVIGSNNVTNAGVNCVTNITTLSTSVQDLALSVTGLTEYGISGTPSSGSSRYITIRNTGTNIATGLQVSFPTFPVGTVSSTTCGSTLGVGGSCTITTTPGPTATSDGTNPCTTGTAPIPGVVAVSAGNATTTTTNVTILGYGCIYQGGYVFAFDDTSLNNGSVGGKVAATTDQAAAFPNGIIWSSNGTGGASGDEVYDSIYGISETSTASSADPSSGHVSGQSACNGSTDGACNTNNIFTYYQDYSANAPVASSDYAAGRCKQIIASYSDWYLPAVCEMGDAAPCGSPSAPVLQNMQASLVDNSSLNLLSGYYFSSTEESFNPSTYAWVANYSSGGGSTFSVVNKGTAAGARCVRALTP